MVSVEGVDVLVEGEGAETIVMMHGWPDTHRLWDAQVEALQGRYRCIRFTLPGFEAGRARRAYSLDELVAFLLRLIERLSPFRKVILMLHDWGCVFGYQFYLRHPELVSKIVGVDIGDPASLRKAMKPREALMGLAYQVWLALAWRAGGRIGDGMTRWMARLARCPSDPALIHSGMNYPYYVMWFGGSRSYRRHARRFSPACPMLFIYGRRKPIRFHAKAWADELAAQPGNQVVAFDTGHWVMSEQPQGFNQVVGDWLAMAQPDYAFRQASAADAPAVAACVHAAYVHYVERIGTTPGPMRDDYAEVIRERQVTVAESGGRLAGVLVLAQAAEGFLLENVAVDPTHKGKGLGRLLLRRAEAEARRAGYDSIYLYTHEKMAENRALYAKIGYVEYDRRSEEGLARVYMRKRLEEGK